MWVNKSSMAAVGTMSEHAVSDEATFHSGNHLCGVREHGGGLLHEVKFDHWRRRGSNGAWQVEKLLKSSSLSTRQNKKDTNTSGDVRQAT